MATVGTAEVEVEISKAKVRREADAAGREIEQSLGGSADKAKKELEDKLGQIRIGAGLGVAAATGFGLAKATKAASDLNETTSKSATVFGEAQAAVLAYAESADQGIGLSKKAALDATSTFGNLFTQLGIGQDEAAGLSTKMVTLAADFGSFFNEDPTAIIEAQTAAFRGEYDALQRYVPTINAAAVEQRALTETGKANADQLTQQEKALATYSLMMEGAGAAQGDFARTSDSAANAQKRAQAEIENSSASLGQALLPLYAAGAEVVGKFAGAFGELPGPVQTGVVGIGGMTLATVLLLPKLVEGGQLLKLGATKALDFARGIDSASAANVAAAGTMGALALGGAVVVKVLSDQAEMAGRTRAAVSDLTDAVTKGGQTMATAIDQSLTEEWTRSGATLEGLGLSFEQYRDLVTGSQGDFEAWAASLPNQDTFLGADEAVAASRQVIEKARGEIARYQEAQAATEGITLNLSEATRNGTAADKAAAEATSYLVEQKKVLVEAATAANQAQMESIQVAREAFDAQRGVTSAEEDYVAAVQEVEDARKGVADAERDVADAQRGVAEAHRAVADARKGVADAERAVEDARKGVADAERQVADAQRAAADAAEAVTTATDDLAQAREDAQIGSEYMADSLQQVADAEERVRQSQEDGLAAQQALDEARANYANTLADLKDNAAGAADDVLSAEIRLRDAQRRLAELGQPDKNGVVKPVTADERLAAEIAIREAERRLREARERAADAQDEYNRNQQAGVDGSDAVVAAQDRVTEAADRQAEAQAALEGAVQNVADTQEAANQRVADAQRTLEDAIRARSDADQAVVDAKDGVVEAQDRVRDAAEGVQDAQQRVRDATQGVADANQRVVDARDAVVDAQKAVEKATDGVADSVLALAGAQFEAGLKTGNTKEEVDKQIDRLGALRDTLDPSNPLRRQLDEYITRLQQTNGHFTATIALNFTDAAGAVISDAQAVLDTVLQRRAKGGRVAPGTPYLVGEERPEVFWPDQAGTIVPSVSMLAGQRTGGGDFVANFHGITDPYEAASLANAEWSWRKSLEPV